LFYNIDANETLRFSSEIKTGISPWHQRYQHHHNHWPSDNEKQVPFLKVLLRKICVINSITTLPFWISIKKQKQKQTKLNNNGNSLKYLQLLRCSNGRDLFSIFGMQDELYYNYILKRVLQCFCKFFMVIYSSYCVSSTVSWGRLYLKVHYYFIFLVM